MNASVIVLLLVLVASLATESVDNAKFRYCAAEKLSGEESRAERRSSRLLVAVSLMVVIVELLEATAEGDFQTIIDDSTTCACATYFLLLLLLIL